MELESNLTEKEVVMYISRHIETTIEKMFSAFPSVLVTGPRQVGKSTLLFNKFAGMKYVSLDDPLQLLALKQDPIGYFKLRGTPLIVDEVQRAPECFAVFKHMIDRDRRAGMYLLTGSQRFELMKGVSESLAGRIGVVNMLGLSDREIYGDPFREPFLPTESYLLGRNSAIPCDLTELWKRIHRGSMPELYSNDRMEWERYYAAYVDTYIERDVKQLSAVGDTLVFARFMVVLASRTGELLNEAALAREVGVDNKTIKSWLSILQASGVIYLLRPFSLNIGKRVVKAPKLYFTDTGLVAYLCRWFTPETLANGAMSGAVYETFIVSEVIKSYLNAGKEPDIYYFRNTDGQEVDLLFYRDGTLYPAEIKKTSSPNIKDVKHFKALASSFPAVKIGEGGVICNADDLLPLGDGVKIIPFTYI